MWDVLKDREFLGLKFRRQYIIKGYILDFYCPELGLAVEIDGSVHEEQREADARRQEILEQAGIIFHRIPSDQVERNRDDVLCELASFAITLLPSPTDDIE